MEDQTPSTDSPIVGTTDADVQAEGTEPVATDNSEPTEQVQETEQDSFFDPNTVPEELKPAYKQMQAAFTKKTQEIAEAKKEAEGIRAQAAEYERIKPFLPIVEQMAAQKQTAGESPEMQALEQQYRAAGYDDESIKFMKMGIGFALNHINQTQTSQRESDRVISQISEAAKVDSRLTDTSLVYPTADGTQVSFGQIVEEIVASDPKWKADPVAATKRAVAKVDALIGKAKTDGKEELSTLAKNKAQKFPQASGSPQSATASNTSMTFAEAAIAAQKETGIRLGR